MVQAFRLATSAGRPYLGAAIDTQDYIRDYTQDHVSQWAQGLSQLSSIAATQPHAAYAVGSPRNGNISMN